MTIVAIMDNGDSSDIDGNSGHDDSSDNDGNNG